MPLAKTQPVQTNVGNKVWMVVVFAGITAALHIWKLPAALPKIQESLGISLVTAGVLLGIVQLAGVVGGLLVALFAESFGARRTLVSGLLLLIFGSILGALSTGAWLLLISRGVEGIGFIMATVVGPGLVRAHAPIPRISVAVACWSAYQGVATLMGLIGSAFLLQVFTWQFLWWTMAGLTLIPVLLVLRFVPSDHVSSFDSVLRAIKSVGITARASQVWLAGFIVGCYTIQWMAVVGFLPTVYSHSGLTGLGPGIATGLVGSLNALGAVVSGMMIQRGASAKFLLILGFAMMAVTSALTFAVDWSGVPSGVIWQVTCVGLFSLFGAVIPATMTILAMDLAPSGGSVSATMGLMQQIFNTGHFMGPILIAWLAVRMGGWSSSWWMTCTFALTGIFLSTALLRRVSRKNFSSR